jgi:UDP-N-acetylmuramoyl-L-alanyl-D-glutamate--2,6-diaminopimelate ligase
VTSHTPAGRPLAELLTGLRHEVRGDPFTLVNDVEYRSEYVRPGALFCCVPGTRTDGHDHAPDSVARGAAALLVERWLPLDVTQAFVPSVRRAMGAVSAHVFGRPAERMKLVGVTGTNGKTTFTYLMESVFRAAGIVPGLIGTTGVRIDGVPAPMPRTTPEAPDLHRLLANMADRGVGAVAMEVSSHGLHQHRVDGVRFSCAVFTNLSQDHLDYHGTLEAYFDAKARLFTPPMAQRAVVNLDDPRGASLLRSGLPTLTYGLSAGSDVRGRDVRTSSEGLVFRVGELVIRSPLRGGFNVANCLAALAAARSIGLDDEAAARGIEAVSAIPGRFEPVDGGQDFLVVVDYAHTPDSIENVLRAARALTHDKVTIVFGAGGDRDRGKRPLMGRAATGLADRAIITSDNPRSEDPGSIISQIERGAREGGGAFEIEPDRRAAIELAIRGAGPGDVVVIAGKGHETGQEFVDRIVPFDDREVAAGVLRELGQ